jgi:hypothetical protein
MREEWHEKSSQNGQDCSKISKPEFLNPFSQVGAENVDF